MKKCNRCEEEKELTEFYKRPENKDGYRNYCKSCKRNEKPINVINYGKICNKCGNDKELTEFYKGSGFCKECFNLRCKNYYLKNKEKIAQKAKIYRINNPEKEKQYIKANKEKTAIYQKEYRQINKEKLNEYKRQNRSKWYAKRRENPLVRFKDNTRATISKSIVRSGYKKNSNTEKILGCDYELFINHIEGQFVGEKSWMNWDNHGKFNGKLNYGWDIDHIIPVNSAKTEEDILKLNHFTNLQPLCSYTNRYIKRDNYVS